MSSSSLRLESGMSSPKVDEEPSLFLIRVPGLAYWNDWDDSSVADGFRNPLRFRMAADDMGIVEKGDVVDFSGFQGPGSKTTDEFLLDNERHGIARTKMRTDTVTGNLIGFMVIRVKSCMLR